MCEGECESSSHPAPGIGARAGACHGLQRPCSPATLPSSSRTGRPLEPHGTPSLEPAAGILPSLLYKLFKKGMLQFPGAVRALLGGQCCKPARLGTVLPATLDALAA